MWVVVEVVRKSRGFGAAVVAAAVMLSGCATDDGNNQGATTSPDAAEPPANPWDVPLEQRPALFDPCEEIPIEAVEEAIGGAVEPNDDLTRHRPGELMACGWKNRQVHISSLATWKSLEDYLADRSFVVQSGTSDSTERSSLRLAEKGDATGRTCLDLFFTSQGAVWVKLDLVGGLRDFKDERFYEACDALDAAIPILLPHIPDGEFS